MNIVTNNMPIQTKSQTISTAGVMLTAITLFLYPKGYILGTVFLLIISLIAGANKQLSWHRNLSLLTIAMLIFILPHALELLQESGHISDIKKAARGIPLLLAGALLIRFKPKQQFVYASFSISLIIAFIIMINEQMTGFNRSDYAGFNINPLMIAIVAVIAFILPSINSRNIWFRVLTYTAFTLGVSTLVMAQSKGPVLGLFSVVLVFSLTPLKSIFSTKRKHILILWLLLLSSVAITSIGTNSALLSRVSIASQNIILHVEKPNSESKVSSTAIRLELWKGALILASEKPYFGYGTFEAKKRMQELFNEGRLASFMQAYTDTHFHSIYFQALGNRGIFGLLTVLLMLLIPAYILFTNRLVNPSYSLSGLLVITSYTVTGIADVSLSATTSSITYFILIIICISQVSINTKKE